MALEPSRPFGETSSQWGKVEQDLKKRDYALYFEVCEGEESFYNITRVPSDNRVLARYLLDDPCGGEKGKALLEGFR